MTHHLGETQTVLARATEYRDELQARVTRLTRDLATATEVEQNLRGREAALLQSFGQDEAIWRDLIGRLEQTIRR